MHFVGKIGTALTVSSRIGEISEARCSPLPEGGSRGISPVLTCAGVDDVPQHAKGVGAQR